MVHNVALPTEKVVARTLAIKYIFYMRNVNEKQVVDIALEILAEKEKVYGNTIPYANNPVSVSTGEIITRFASKGIHASLYSVVAFLQHNFRHVTKNNSSRWAL